MPYHPFHFCFSLHCSFFSLIVVSTLQFTSLPSTLCSCHFNFSLLCSGSETVCLVSIEGKRDWSYFQIIYTNRNKTSLSHCCCLFFYKTLSALSLSLISLFHFLCFISFTLCQSLPFSFYYSYTDMQYISHRSTVILRAPT